MSDLYSFCGRLSCNVVVRRLFSQLTFSHLLCFPFFFFFFLLFSYLFLLRLYAMRHAQKTHTLTQKQTKHSRLFPISFSHYSQL